MVNPERRKYPHFVVKRETKKLKEAIVEKYNWQCPWCHKWLSREQRRGHGCVSSSR